MMLLELEKQLLARGTELYAHKGEYLYYTQQPAEFIFYLKDGAVEIFDEAENTRQHLQGCRCFLGLTEALLNTNHDKTVKVNAESILLVFDKEQIDDFLLENQHARRYFMTKLCDQMGYLKKSYE